MISCPILVGGGGNSFNLMPIETGIGYYYDFLNYDVGTAPSTVLNKGISSENLSIYNSTILSNHFLQTTGAGNDSYASTIECYLGFTNLIVYGVAQLIQINTPNWLFSTTSSTYNYGIGLGRIVQSDNKQYAYHFINGGALSQNETQLQTCVENIFSYCYMIDENNKITHFTYSYPNKFTKYEVNVDNWNNNTIQSLSQCVLGGYIKGGIKYGGATVNHGMIAVGNQKHSFADIAYNLKYLCNKYNP